MTPTIHTATYVNLSDIRFDGISEETVEQFHNNIGDKFSWGDTPVTLVTASQILEAFDEADASVNDEKDKEDKDDPNAVFQVRKTICDLIGSHYVNLAA